MGYSSPPQKKKSLHRPPTPHFSLSFLPQPCAGLHFNAVDKLLPVKAITHTEGETGREGAVGGTEEPEIMPRGCVYVKRENSARININRASQGMGGISAEFKLAHTSLSMHLWNVQAPRRTHAHLQPHMHSQSKCYTHQSEWLLVKKKKTTTKNCG